MLTAVMVSTLTCSGCGTKPEGSGTLLLSDSSIVCPQCLVTNGWVLADPAKGEVNMCTNCGDAPATSCQSCLDSAVDDRVNGCDNCGDQDREVLCDGCRGDNGSPSCWECGDDVSADGIYCTAHHPTVCLYFEHGVSCDAEIPDDQVRCAEHRKPAPVVSDDGNVELDGIEVRFGDA